jgi:hypothetical protein
MNDKHRNIAEAQFEEIRDFDFEKLIGQGLDLLTKGRKGQVVTAALISGGYVTDPAKITAFYNANSRTIDAYLDHVNTPQLFKDAISKTDAGLSAKRSAGSFVLGFALGSAVVGGVWYFKSRKRRAK